MNYSMSRIKAINEAKGFHFFERSAMRFFNSRICGKEAFSNGTLAYFVTSEKYGSDSKRLYTIRGMNLDTGIINTIGSFQMYFSIREAMKIINTVLLDGSVKI